MKILVCARHFGYLRNFESALIELAERGHTLHLAADRPEQSGGLAMVERIAAAFPRVTVGWTPPRAKDDHWFDLASGIRLSQDFLRYLEAPYARSPMLRRRSKERTPALTVWLAERAGFRFRPGRAVLSAVLTAAEHAVPLHEPYRAFLQEQAPDVVLLTPLIDLGSPQLDLFKAAQALGLRTTLAVGSWDHLSSKALMRGLPDLVTVWNDVQRDEAVTMHRLPAARIAVTGAQCYDQWFDRRPERTRAAFCQAMGLPIDRPFVLYLCSSLFRKDPPEADFVVQWLQALRESRDSRLSGIGVLVRPHPGRFDEWARHDVTSLDVAFHGTNPIDDESRRDYFEALYYAAAVVGLNTSAFIEAGIVGRPVLAVLPREYWRSQEGTLHFDYLLKAGGGLLRTTRTLEDHLAQLAAAVAGEAPADHRGFLTAFVRPYGLDVPATPRFAEAIEALGREPAPAPRRPSIVGIVAARPILAGIVAKRRAEASGRRLYHEGRRALRRSRGQLIRSARRPLKQLAKRLGDGWETPVSRGDGGSGHADVAAAREAREAVASLRASGRPIVVGPWLSETGFELLYWIPFLRWAQRYGSLRPSRIIAVSRGGARAWYAGLAEHYVDVLEVAEVADVVRANAERIAAQEGQKQYAPTRFDADVVEQAARKVAAGGFDWLHPGLMYNLFRPFWMQAASTALVGDFTVPRRLDRSALAPIAGLPARYVAAKFYTNQALPGNEANERFVASLVRRLAERHHVVLLNTGVTLDDHGEFAPDVSSRIHRVDHLMTPATNLDIQTRVIAHADHLIATYGGFSYVGPLLGVRTLAFYSDAAGFRRDHLEMAERTFREVDGASFMALQTSQLTLFDELLPRAAASIAG